MDEQHFLNYQVSEKAGLKRQAKESIHLFCNSFASLDEKETWVRANIASLATNSASRIRHELYEQVVFPVLAAGYEKNDAYCLHWLGRTGENLISARDLHDLVDGLGPSEYHKRAFALDSETVEIRRFYLGAMMNEFNFIEHEWPLGLLIGPPTKENCDAFEKRLSFAKSLDVEGHETARLKQLSERLAEYRQRYDGSGGC